MKSNPLCSRWDKLLDWFEFDFEPFCFRRRRALAVIAIALAVLSVLAASWAYAAIAPNAPSAAFVIIEQQLLQDAVDLIERQEAEIKRLRARCNGVAI